HGKVRGVARGARRKYSRFAGALQPLAKANVTWFHKEGRDLARISAVELVRPARRLQSDLEGILLGGCLAGHVLEFAQENDPSEHLYRLLDSTLEALLAGVDRRLAARYFEAWTLRLAGIFPPPRRCPECGRSLERGAVLGAGDDALRCSGCGTGSPVSAAAVELLLRIGREALPALAADPPAAGVVAELEQLTGRIRRAFLQHELKSYRVMQEILCSPSRT
ncbi:MAG: DNA repair protein RecO, partial [Acidobacteriota bacterium]|nr:DNA repair protein RecO [Acidobacteriota bacterium]